MSKLYSAYYATALSIALCSSLCASSAPLTPEEALRNAEKYFSSTSSSRGKKALEQLQLRHAYTAKSRSGNALYVFSDNEKGIFTIVAADSRITPLLGYSFNNGFNAENIPCNVQWWLDEYTRQIESYLETNPAEAEPSTRGIEISDNRKPISPLIATKWNQSAPYNKMCPEMNGHLCVTGCVATAMAQVMKFHNWPPKGNGMRNDYSFTHELHWDDMLNDYLPGKFSDAEANAVALLMLDCGKAVDMSYSPYASGAQAFKMQHAFPVYFDYSREIRYLMRDYYSQAEWDQIIYDQLADNHPVLYGGQSTEGGHSFVCDGYSEDGYFHINWGWGGLSDGYFRLNALTPSQNGIGGFEGGYNSSQAALINIYKNNGAGEMQTQIVANGPFVYQDDLFCVDGDGPKKGLMYNALEESIFLNVGLKILDKEGNYVTTAIDPEGTRLEAYYGFQGFNVEFPVLEDGEYTLHPVYRTPESDWLPILIPYGTQQFVTLIVKDGKLSFVNNGLPQSMKTALISSDIEVNPYPSSGTQLSFVSYISNVGEGDYKGEVTYLLKDNEGDVAMQRSVTVDIPARNSSAVAVSHQCNAPAGTYTLALYDAENNLISEPEEVVVTNTITPVKIDSKVTFNINGPIFVEGSGASLSTFLSNSSNENQNISVRIRLRSADGKEIISDTQASPMTVPSLYFGNFTFSNFPLFNTEGDWLIDIVDLSGNPMSNILPVTVHSAPMEINNLNLSMTGIEDATLLRPQSGEYSGTVDIINDDYFYTFRSIAGNAFTFASSLKKVIIPPTISRIGASTFYCANQLETISLKSVTPPSISEMAMPAERFSQVVLDVPGNLANVYKRTDVWSRFNVPGWDIEMDEDLSVIQGLDKDKDGQIYNPYYTALNSKLEFSILVPAGKVLKIAYNTPDGDSKEFYSWNGIVTLPSLSKSVGKVKISTVSSESVNQVPDSAIGDLYNLDGIMVQKNVSKEELQDFPSGFYIFNGKVIRIANY